MSRCARREKNRLPRYFVSRTVLSNLAYTIEKYMDAGSILYVYTTIELLMILLTLNFFLHHITDIVQLINVISVLILLNDNAFEYVN